MKNLIRLTTILLASLLLFSGCGNIMSGNLMKNKQSTQPATPSIDITGSKWEITMGPTFKGTKNAIVTFNADGKFKNHNPKNTTPDNEYWKMNGNTITFGFNNWFSTYTGSISADGNQMSGKAVNKNGLEWSWTSIIIK